MESKGRVIAILDRRDGVSAKTGKAWASQCFVIETQDQYPVKQHFEVFGVERVADVFGKLAIGADVVVQFDMSSREFTRQDGTTTWLTSARAWKVEGAISAQPQQAYAEAPVQGASPFPPMQTAEAQMQEATNDDGMPF